MSSKKKLIISLSVAAAVLVAAIIAIVAVFAATRQAVTSNITVRYTADPTISGTASATYTFGTTVGEDMTATGNADGEKVVTFDPDDTTGQGGVLQPQREIVLGEGTGETKVREVIFEYTFTNTGRDAYTAVVSITPLTGNDAKVTDNVVYEYNTGSGFKTASTEADRTITVQPTGAEFKMQIKIAVDNVAKDAAFFGSINWDLNRVAPTQP